MDTGTSQLPSLSFDEILDLLSAVCYSNDPPFLMQYGQCNRAINLVSFTPQLCFLAIMEGHSTPANPQQIPHTVLIRPNSCQPYPQLQILLTGVTHPQLIKPKDKSLVFQYYKILLGRSVCLGQILNVFHKTFLDVPCMAMMMTPKQSVSESVHFGVLWLPLIY